MYTFASNPILFTCACIHVHCICIKNTLNLSSGRYWVHAVSNRHSSSRCHTMRPTIAASRSHVTRGRRSRLCGELVLMMGHCTAMHGNGWVIRIRSLRHPSKSETHNKIACTHVRVHVQCTCTYNFTWVLLWSRQTHSSYTLVYARENTSNRETILCYGCGLWACRYTNRVIPSTLVSCT